MSHFPDLLTERLLLRPLVPGDDTDLFLLRSDNEVNRYLDRARPKDIGDARQFISTINDGILENKFVYWVITEGEGDAWSVRGRLIGTIGLYNFSEDRLTAELGYELLPAFQGRGIMQEALTKVLWFGFRILGLEQVEAFTHRDNERSMKLLSKNGFLLAPSSPEGYDRFVRARDMEKK
jgi:ribosomal-protein-alanine N-acetyltransferase